MSRPLPAVVRALRPGQWSKNVLVAAAPIAAGRLVEGSVAWRTFAAFAAFSLVASATYLGNDAADVEADRLHPVKRFRPIAAGELSATNAIAVAVALGTFGVVLGFALNVGFAVVLCCYLILTLLYSIWLKHIGWVDVIVVAAGFTLRAVGGGLAAEVPISRAFVVVVSAGALLLIIGKRLGELHTVATATQTRPVLRFYDHGSLRVAAIVAAATAGIGYLAWATVESSEADRTAAAVWLSVLPFGAAVARYTWLSIAGRGEEPHRLVFRDRILIGLAALWAGTYLAAVYA